MIKNIVFDMGGVLINDNAMDFAARYVQDQADLELLKDELFLSYEWREGWDNGTMIMEDLVNSVCARLPERLHEVVRQITENWNMDAELIPGMEDLIRSLKKQGWNIYLLSNTALSFYQYRHRLPAIDVFDGEFISAEHHLLKPQREIYEKFVQVFGLEARECYFIDDKPENVKGAIDALWGGGFVFGGDAATLEKALRGLELKQV